MIIKYLLSKILVKAEVSGLSGTTVYAHAFIPLFTEHGPYVLLCFSSFKLFLELEPQLRDIIHKFNESNYASCLKLLDEIKVSITDKLIVSFSSDILLLTGMHNLWEKMGLFIY